ncbi:MAG: DUF4410 domain-containing protein [Candidatus Omnitrophica bacterium]|nr:DUF4410 domain-containing protein [Candidatus Omnitrophota bacterium]MBU1923105.1 DUF4410 domain-containing protein [Candidatus Omnitrophota bacterium]
MKKKRKILMVLGIWFIVAVCVFVAQTMAQESQNVYVADFLFDEQAIIQKDDSRHGPLEGLRPRIFRQKDQERSVEQTEDLVQLLSQSLVGELNKKGIPASRVSSFNELVSDGVLVQGEFLDLDEGDPLKQAAVGLNTGAAKMEIKVMISKLPLDMSKPGEVLDLQSSSASKGPGGILGLAICGNPYVLAAKFVMAKHTAEKDVRKLASEIANEIQSYLQKQQTM